jgi:hypothetical protein
VDERRAGCSIEGISAQDRELRQQGSNPRSAATNKPDMTQPVDQTPAPEPSREGQEDIAARVQGGLASANENRKEREPAPATDKATQFDGSPNPEGAADDLTHPKDDTPAILPKKEDT